MTNQSLVFFFFFFSSLDSGNRTLLLKYKLRHRKKLTKQRAVKVCSGRLQCGTVPLPMTRFISQTQQGELGWMADNE